MDSVSEHEVALNFIHLQLVELSRDCGNTVKNGQVNAQYFIELQKKLEKILHETRAACSPPVTQPVMSDFKTISCIGQGAFGTVKLMDHRKTDRSYAVKAIKRHKATNMWRYQILLERDILKFSDNPFIVSMFCSFETETHYCMALEVAGGGDCDSLLDKHGRLSVDLTRLYMAETVLALEYLHGYGVVHRDVKPSNLLISSTGHIKLADFGFATIGPINMTVNLKQANLYDIIKEFPGTEKLGTPLYMSPEMILFHGYGKSTDWWALGINLYEFLLGITPFEGETLDELFVHVTNMAIPWPGGKANDLPADAKDIITSLLQKDCVLRLGTRGASEIKTHPFFRGLDWENLLNQKVPQMEEESNCSSESSSIHITDADESNVKETPEAVVTDLPVDIPNFCTVAYRFKEVYGSPEHLSLRDLQSTFSSISRVEEQGKEKGLKEVEVDEGYSAEDSLSRHKDKTFAEVIRSGEMPSPDNLQDQRKGKTWRSRLGAGVRSMRRFFLNLSLIKKISELDKNNIRPD